MYKAYNWNNIHAGNWKNVDCSGHMIHRIKSTECAWQEGWATYFMLDVWNTKRYNFSDGSWYDLEVRSSSSGNFFEATDACEGNVAATLLDLIDPYNDGFDAADFETRHTWKVLRRGLQNTTAEYYQAWGLQGYDQAKFRGAAKQNTINY